MATDFYADLRSPSHVHVNSSILGATEHSGIGKPVIERSDVESTLDDHMCTLMDYNDTLEEQVYTFRGCIREIEEDILARVREADPNFFSGLCKFISTYRKMQQSSHAPNSTIAYTFHNFGRPDSKLK